MTKIIFKNLKKSELVKSIAKNYLSDLINKFPLLENSRITLTLSMQNSPIQAGPDLFTVKFLCGTGKYKGVIMQKSSQNLYKALSDLSDGLLERLNRFGDKKRILNIKNARMARKAQVQAQWSKEDEYLEKKSAI